MFDDEAFGQALYLTTLQAVLSHFSAFPQQNFYAVAFHHVELESVVPPCVSYQCIENLGDEPERWDSATWCNLPVVENWLNEQMLVLARLQEALSPPRWKACVRRLEKTLIAVCKRLSIELKKCCTNLTPDFAVLILDDDFRLTPKCVSKAHLLRLFPHLVESLNGAAKIKRLSLGQQIEFHVAALLSDDVLQSSDAERALREIGPVAAPEIARRLGAAENRWRLAMLLDHYCVRSPEVINALKQVLPSAHGPNLIWIASALATLGEWKYLLGQSELGDKLLVRAMLHPLIWRTGILDPLPLSYTSIEMLLQRRPATEHLLLAEMESAGFGEITREDVPQALEGTLHPFAGIRRHAVYVLGKKALGKANGRRIVAALLPLLDDPNQRVQYNTLVSLSRWLALLPNAPELFGRFAAEHQAKATRDIASAILVALASRADLAD